MTRAWLLNLHAEDELAALRAGQQPKFRPLDAPARAVAALTGRGDTGLVRARDLVITEAWTDANGRAGACWCPTPSAVLALRATGATVAEPPRFEALTAANARETFADVAPLRGETVVRSVAELQASVAQAAPERPSGKRPAWLLRESLTAAGRRRCLAERWSDDIQRFAAKALSLGPIHVAPVVDIDLEVTVHGWIEPTGAIALGPPLGQVVRGGTWSGCDGDAAVTPRERDLLTTAARDVGDRLVAIGYHGPYGMDAFRWLAPLLGGGCAPQWNAPAEVNGRFTMSFAASGLLDRCFR